MPNLVGLALSGGGVRSACVSLGLLQALHQCGLLRFVDYLSTVLGGGYAGAFLSSLALSKKQKLDQDNFPIAADRMNKPPWRMSKFIYGGKYLNEPLEFLNKYLVGLFQVNAPIVSGMIMLAALFALFWRVFDYEPIRQSARRLGLDHDLYFAFLPFIISAVAWLFWWWRACADVQRERHSHRARFMLVVTLFTFAIGIVVVLGNVKTDLGFLRALLGVEQVKYNKTLVNSLCALVGASALPLIRPMALLRRYLHPKGLLDRWLLPIASFALLIGIPLLLVGIFARQNFSGIADRPSRELAPDDICDWEGLAQTIRSDFTALLSDDGRPLAGQALGGADRDTYQARAAQATLWTNTTKLLGRAPRGDRKAAVELAQLLPQIQQAIRTLKERDLDMAEPTSLPSLVTRGARWLVSGFSLRGVPRALKDAQRDLAAKEQRACEILNKHILGARELFGWDDQDVSFARAFELGLSRNGRGPSLGFAKLIPARLEASESLLDLVHRAAPTKMKEWSLEERKAFNREVLATLLPELFHPASFASREIVWSSDQWARFRWFLGAAAVFFLLGVHVDLNNSSLHRFYRNQLAHAFIEPIDNQLGEGVVKEPSWLTRLANWGRPSTRASRDCDLSQLETTRYGAPYHLITASFCLANPFWPRRSRFQNRAEAKEGMDPFYDPATEAFLFSQLNCGSDLTSSVATDKYERSLRENISFADAIALSGAAVTPVNANLGLMTLLMTIMNFRLGQWLPNPRQYVGTNHVETAHRPRVRRMLDALSKPPEQRRYCFIADGGFSENLGIMPLLKRKCKLIIALDAGQDPKHEFADLARLIRAARVREGIDIVAASQSDGEPLDTTPLKLDGKSFCREHYLVARIRYSANEHGWLIYLKPSLTGKEGIDILEYQSRDPDFPHQSTANQFYSDTQVECYRSLGFEMGKKISTLIPARGESSSLWNDLINWDQLENRFDARISDEPSAPIDLPTEWHAAGENFYHNNIECATGNSIPLRFLRPGRPPKSTRLCTRCLELQSHENN